MRRDRLLQRRKALFQTGVLDLIRALKKDKLQLSKLESGGADVLATLDCLAFMERAVFVLVQSKESMDAMSKVNPKMAIERLKLLGPGGTKIMETLGLAPRSRK